MRQHLLVATVALSASLFASVAAAADPTPVAPTPPVAADPANPTPAPTTAPATPAAVVDAPAAKPATTDTTPPPALPPTVDVPKSDGMALHIESPIPANLEHRATPASAWESVCSTPCDTQAKLGEEYRVLGTDVAPSAPFMIDGAKTNATLRVSPGSIRKSRLGLGFLIGGGVLGVASIITLIAGGVFDGFGDGGVVSQTRTDLLFAGSFMLIGALATGTWGGATWYNNKTSTVDGALVTGGKSEPMPAPKTSFTFPVLRLQF